MTRSELVEIIANKQRHLDGQDVELAVKRMLEHMSQALAAGERIEAEGLAGEFTASKMGVDGMDSLPAGSFDAVVSTLVFSELNDDERRFALKHAARVLKPGGRIIIADEVVPRAGGQRFVQNMVRLPMLAVTYLVSSSVTGPIKDLAGEMETAGFRIVKEERSHGDSFIIITGIKQEEGQR